jgi:hypothetical protein
MPWVEIHMKISQKMKSTQGIPIYLKIVKDTRRWGSKKIFNGLHQPEDNIVGDAPTYEAPSAQDRDFLEERSG